MTKELGPGSVGSLAVKKIGEFLDKDSDTTVSEAQLAAFRRIADALPEGRFKEFVNRFEKTQEISSKLNELMINVQDQTWKIARPFVAIGAPITMAIPKDPFSKLSIKGSRLGAALGEKVIKTTVEQTEKVVAKVKNFKKEKKSE